MNTVPCPGRIIADAGDGFQTGLGLGIVWYFGKGAWYAIRKERIRGAPQELKVHFV